MRVLWSWLSELVDLSDVNPRDAAALLSAHSVKVERVHEVGRGLDEVVIARTLEVRAHPNADRLRLVDVQLPDRVATVVCGAPNVATGQTVAYAAAGARLPGREPLEARRIRGIVSEGMICSASELGLSEDHSGILVLDDGPQPGTPLNRVIPAETVLHLEVTSNRPDCLGHLGVARELSAVLRRPMLAPVDSLTPPEGNLPVEVRDSGLCRRYMGLSLAGAVVRDSPEQIRRRLVLAGVRPISNAVDVTNYVMLETGQPLHVFDRALLEGDRIIVRRAVAGETLNCLDGVERRLEDADLVIADARRPVALAGVIGGMDSAVTPATSEIILEAATFSPRFVRAMSRRHAVRTESSLRFEKGLSPELAPVAARRALALLQELTGASPGPGTDCYAAEHHPVEIRISRGTFGDMLGTELGDAEPEESLRALGFEVAVSGDLLTAAPPRLRLDVSIPEDLVEEVGRLHGYDRIPSRLPGRPRRVTEPSQPADPRERLRDVLLGAGFDEAITNSLVHSALLAASGFRHWVALQNPMSSELDAFRTVLMTGLLGAARRNVEHGNRSLRLFEIGITAGPLPGNGELPPQRERLGLVALEADGDCRAGVARIAGALSLSVAGRVQGMEWRPDDHPGYEPGRSWALTLGGDVLGYCGQLVDAVTSAHGLESPVAYAEINLAPILAPAPPKRADPLPRFPAVLQDLAVEVSAAIPAGELVAAIKDAGGALLESVTPFDDYRGPQVAEGNKSLALRLVFRSHEGTLSEEAVLPARRAVIEALELRFGARLR
jgi:phenylalanyl-tRNA synthetase beta chain